MKRVMHIIDLSSPDATASAHYQSGHHAGAQRAGAHIRQYQLWTLLAIFAFFPACKKAAPPPPVVRPVRSIDVEKRQVGDPKVVTGHLRARDEVNLAFRISGRIMERKVGVGDMVKAGQTVALLDAEVERNSRNSAQADVAAARATLDQSEAFERRQKKLLTELVISPNEYDSALRQLKTSQAQLDAAQAKLKSAEEQLGYTELKSDAAGVITEKGAEVGEVVPAGKMVLQVAQQTGRDAVFDVPAQAIRDGLSLGAQGEVWLADHPEIKADGKVREISPQADPVTRNYQVKVELADPPAGMFLGATILGRLKLKAESVIEVPSSALTMIEDKPAVWVVDAKGSARSSAGNRHCAPCAGLCHRDGRAGIRRKGGYSRRAGAP